MKLCPSLRPVPLITLILASSFLLSAQEEPTFRTQVLNVVLVPALVRDKAGDTVYGLQSGDFIIEDDGVPQAVRLDEAAEAEPVSLVVAIQTGRRADFELPRMRGLEPCWLSRVPRAGQQQGRLF